MPEKLLLEFFPEIVQLLPESPGGSCCLKPIITQSKLSKQMYALAQHIRWKYNDKIELIIPSKSESRVTLVKKYQQLKSDQRLRKLGIRKLPALALAGKIILQGEIIPELEVDTIVEKMMTYKKN